MVGDGPGMSLFRFELGGCETGNVVNGPSDILRLLGGLPRNFAPSVALLDLQADDTTEPGFRRGRELGSAFSERPSRVGESGRVLVADSGAGWRYIGCVSRLSGASLICTLISGADAL